METLPIWIFGVLLMVPITKTEMFGRTGNQQQYNINVSGGTKQMTYSVSYAHNEEKKYHA